ncbi:ATP-binding protein [Georgenia sp. 10Sc9-8]|uniref:Sensor-like histidine kinase SenX3 n=1 Tax=Georgenia halotolerans TaxID=3028317 RepID=A0ABT5TXV0_9MICO|nr:ATP-binding protein [Georgenia halotolerans]
MEPTWQLVLAALLGLLGGAAGVVAFRVRDRQRHHRPRAAELPAVSPEVMAVLSVLRSTVVMLDADDDVVRASPSAYGLGMVRDDRLVHAELRELVTATRRDGVIRDEELILPRGPLAGTGTLRLQLRVAALTADRVLLLADDRTAARRLEEMRRDFVANVSHELKTPVGAISLLAETVRNNPDDPETVRRFTDRMQREARRLSALVQQIIDLSRLQEPDALIDSELVAVDEVVAEAVDRVAVEARARNIVVAQGGTPGLCVHGDPALLTTAVRNLLDNAVRHSPPATRVSVGVSRGDGLVRVAVVDQGIGIPEDKRERVFERFYRIDAARSRQTGGTGLGLSIVKHIAADHGGRVDLWSTPGRGSTFTLVLPEAQGGSDAAALSTPEPTTEESTQ